MKKSIYSVLLCLATITMFTACASNDETNESTENNVVINATQFTLTEEAYGEDIEVTRAVSEKTKPEIVDLGNGLEAELSIERDTANAKVKQATRATMSNQHYTIYALQGGTRVGSVLKGTVNGTGAHQKFIPDAGYADKFILPAGTYTFVCYNDKVQDDGTNLSVSQANADKALIGTTTIAISGVRYNVNFIMKHQAARVRVKLMTYWPIQDIKGNLVADNINKKAIYQIDPSLTPIYSEPNAFSAVLNFPNDLTEEPYGTDEYGKYYSTTPDYQYVLPGTNANQFSLKFTSGELYRDPSHQSKSLVGYSHKIKSSTPLVANGSYIFRVNIYYKANYLFEDGVVRTYANRGAHTAIAAVLKDNDGSPYSGTAIAMLIEGVRQWATTHPQKDNLTTIWNFATHASVMDGVSQTWSEYYTPDGTVKANSTRYPAFYYGANKFDTRDPVGLKTTRLGSNLSRWYLPSIGEWKLAAHVLGYLDLSTVNDFGNYTNGWDYQMYKVYFLQAGGQYFPVNYCWSTAELNNDYVCWAANTEDEGFKFGSTGKWETLFIHPFIHF